MPTREEVWEAEDRWLDGASADDQQRKIKLRSDIIEALDRAMSGGLPTDIACGEVAEIAVNYWRHHVGEDNLWRLNVLLGLPNAPTADQPTPSA